MKYILTFFIITFAFASFSQIDETKVKAALIYNIGENIQWPNENQYSEFTIGVFSGDSILISELENVASVYRLKGKPIKIKPIYNINDIHENQILYIGSENNYLLTEISDFLTDKNILRITDQSSDQLFIMINLVRDKKNKTISYEVNKENIEAENLSYTNDLLLYGGSLVDIKELYKQTNQLLARETKKIEEFQELLHSLQKEKDSLELSTLELNKKIDDLLSDINSKEKELAGLSIDVNQKDSILLVRTKQLNTFLSRSENLQKQINEARIQLSSLDKAIIEKQDSLEQKNIILSQKDAVIGKKDILLDEHKARIKTQKTLLIVSIALAVTFVLAFILFLRMYAIKRRMNERLEELVKDRTKELQESKSHFQSLFESSPVCLWELDLSKLYSFLKSQNKQGEELIEHFNNNDALVKEAIQSMELIDVNFETLNLFEAVTKKEFLDNYSKTYETENIKDLFGVYNAMLDNQEYYEYETTRRTLKGTDINLIINWIILPNKQSKYSNVLVSMQDITDLKAYEKELTKHRDHLEELVTERTNEIQQLNEELFATNEELHTKNEDLVSKHNQLEETIAKLQETQNQLIQSEKMASLGLLTAGIAHELNNPINFISAGNQALRVVFSQFTNILSLHEKNDNNIELYKTELQGILDRMLDRKMKDSVLSVIDNIDTGVDRSTEIIKGLKIYSRSNGDEISTYDIRDAIKSTLLILGNRYKGRIKVSEYYPENAEIECIPGKINQVFMNILSNAIDSITETGDILINVEQRKNDVRISVKDSGKGIPSEIKSKIFDPFFTTKEVGKGTGLGLYISYGIIQQHKGKLDVFSVPGEGSEFLISLPIKH